MTVTVSESWTTADAESDAWVIPLHGIDAPADVIQFPMAHRETIHEPVSMPFGDAMDDDELPTIEFRPQLRRSA
jgi:hypothetical protein